MRDIDLWKAPLVRIGEPVSEVKAKLADADLEIPLVVDESGRPMGWLSERGLQGERVREDFRSPAEPVVELDDILRDALSDLLSADSQYGPVVDKDGRVAGVLSIEALSHALTVPAENVPSATELAVGGLIVPDLGYVPVLAQLGDDFFGNREGAAEKCPGNNGLCPGWIADNFSDYIDPFWEHVLLSIVPLAIGFVIATSLALFAHRYRVAQPFFLAFVGALFTIPSIAFYLILLNITGRGFGTAVVVLTAYTQVLIYRNVMTGLQEVPGRDGRRRRGHGPHAAPDPLAGGAADGAADDLRRPADRRLLDGRHRGLRVLRGRRRAGRRDLQRPGLQGQRGRRRRC